MAKQKPVNKKTVLSKIVIQKQNEIDKLTKELKRRDRENFTKQWEAEAAEKSPVRQAIEEKKIVEVPAVPVPEPLKSTSTDEFEKELLEPTTGDEEKGSESDEDLFKQFEPKEEGSDTDEEEDEEESTDKPRIKKGLGEKLTDIAEDEDEDDEYQSPADLRKIAKAQAVVEVESGALGLAVLAQIIMGDWSEEAEQRYAISEARKEAIVKPLAEIHRLSKKKSSPTAALVTAILLGAAPIGAKVFQDIGKKKKATADRYADFQKNKLREERMQKGLDPDTGLQRNTNYVPNYPKLEIVKKEEKSEVVKTNSSEKRGRHKKSCPAAKGKKGKCNCK